MSFRLSYVNYQTECFDGALVINDVAAHLQAVGSNLTGTWVCRMFSYGFTPQPYVWDVTGVKAK